MTIGQHQQLDLGHLGSALSALGLSGFLEVPDPAVRSILVETELAGSGPQRPSLLFATNHLFGLGPTRDETSALRRVLSLVEAYREHLLNEILLALRRLADDEALAETLIQIDHLSPELLPLVSDRPEPRQSNWSDWDLKVWQAPDSVTLMAKVVDHPYDLPMKPTGTAVAVGFDWLSWTTPTAPPSPAPWGDVQPLQSALATARHPFWGALVATLDACTGDYPWQSLMIRRRSLNSRHRALGSAETMLRDLWVSELGLFPAAPLIIPTTGSFDQEKTLPWLGPALDQMAAAGVAVVTEGSWRLTDTFRTRLMEDDEHMMVFETIRQRSLRLARAAERTAGKTQQAVTQ